ncbi:MAG: DnaA ATPase domain-containing protein [Dissulfurispiraceae bacterium]
MTSKENIPLINIDEHHLLFVVLNKNLLINNKLRETASEATLFVPSFFVQEQLMEIHKEIEEALHKPVKIKVDKSLFPAEQPNFPAFEKGQGIIVSYNPDNYLSMPYFVSPCNEMAHTHFMSLVYKKKEKGITFLYGKSGVGKSHLAYHTATKAKEKGFSVYVNETTLFFDDLKKLDTQIEVEKAFKAYDFIILDNFQLITQEGRLRFDRSFFPLCDRASMNKLNLILISDQPFSTFKALPERTLTRLHAGYDVSLKLADFELKTAMLDYYCVRNEIKINDEVRDLLIKHSTTPRTLLAGLNALGLYEADAGELRGALLRKLEMLNPAVLTDSFAAVENYLSDYYGLDSKEKPTGAYTPRNVSKFRQMMYYLFQGEIDIKELRKRLNIDSKFHGRSLTFGEKTYKAMSADVRGRIERLMSVET